MAESWFELKTIWFWGTVSQWGASQFYYSSSSWPDLIKRQGVIHSKAEPKEQKLEKVPNGWLMPSFLWPSYCPGNFHYGPGWLSIEYLHHSPLWFYITVSQREFITLLTNLNNFLLCYWLETLSQRFPTWGLLCLASYNKEFQNLSVDQKNKIPSRCHFSKNI